MVNLIIGVLQHPLKKDLNGAKANQTPPFIGGIRVEKKRHAGQSDAPLVTAMMETSKFVTQL
jgi:hypothetical protein